MPTSYTRGGDEIDGMIAARMRAAEHDLHEYGVRVGVLMAYNPAGGAVKHGGYAAAATIKVVALRDRVTKNYDAELLIDQSVWDELRPKQREALIAHELRHVALVRKKSPDSNRFEVQYDDIGRPKLKSRLGDWNAGDGFAAVVSEFGDDAIEFENLRSCWWRAEAAAQEGVDPAKPTLFDGAAESA